MRARQGAGALAASRVLLGTAMLVAPARVTAPWLGEAAASRSFVRALARSLGARDVALGLATLQTIGDPVAGARVQAACAAADLADALATVLARRELPGRGALGVSALAGAAAGFGLYSARRQAASGTAAP